MSINTNMQGMFQGCEQLEEILWSNFDTSSVKDMSYMFNNCKNLKSIDLSNFDTSKATNMNSMFRYIGIKVLDLRSFNIFI